MNPQSSITLPLGVAIYYLAKVTNRNGEHARLLKNKNIKGKPNILLGQSNKHSGEHARILKNKSIKVNNIYYSSQTEHNLIIHRIPANTT